MLKNMVFLRIFKGFTLIVTKIWGSHIYLNSSSVTVVYDGAAFFL